MVHTNITFTNTTTTVTLGLTGFEEIVSKKLQSKLTTPQASNSYGQTVKDTKILDLMQIEYIYVINAEISPNLNPDTSLGLGNDTHTSAVDKKNDLKSILEYGGVFNMYVDDTTPIIVNMEGKCSIKKVLTDGIDAKDGESQYTIMMTLVKGINMVGD